MLVFKLRNSGLPDYPEPVLNQRLGRTRRRCTIQDAVSHVSSLALFEADPTASVILVDEVGGGRSVAIGGSDFLLPLV